MKTKSWIAVGSAAVFVVLYFVFTQVGQSRSDAACGLGLSPGAPGFAEAEARQAAEVKKNGYQRVCETNLERFDISFSSKDLADADLAFTPVDLAGTPFAQLTKLGLMVEPVNGIPSRLYRGFRMPDGRRLTLFEHDMSADGTSMWRDLKNAPELVRGLPARLNVMQTPSGKAVSHLSWLEGRRYYELWIDANVAGKPLRDQLFALAASLPASVPACPNEPPPRTVKLGPDGLPDDEPPPAVLTEADMKRLGSPRPCK